MKQIWKYKVQHGRNEIMMPEGACIISAGSVWGLVVWAVVEPAKPLVKMVVLVVWTGEPSEGLGDHCSFVGTVAQASVDSAGLPAVLVSHVYWDMKASEGKR